MRKKLDTTEIVGVDFYLGGKQNMYAASGFAAGDITASKALSSAYDAGSGEWILTYTIPTQEGVLNSFDWTHKSIAEISADTVGYHIFLNNYGESGSYSVYAQYENSGTLYTIDSGTLASGRNEIALTAFASDRGKVKQLIFEFDGSIVKLGIEKTVVYGG